MRREPDGLAGEAVEESRAGTILRVLVRPRSAREGVIGVHAGAVAIGVRASPERGKATRAALGVLADWLEIPPSRLAVVSGGAVRRKRIAVSGIAASDLRKRVARLAREADSAGRRG